MKVNEVIEGIQILEQYRDKPNGYDLGAEHDVLYAYATNKPLSPEHVARMIELGWTQEDVECEEFTADVYDPEESWSAYV